jgi:hypothetical protein
MVYVPDKLTTTETRGHDHDHDHGHGHDHNFAEGAGGGGNWNGGGWSGGSRNGDLSTTRTPSASSNQPPGALLGSPYYQPTAAVPTVTPTSNLDSQPRTTQTMNGYVGGIVQTTDIFGHTTSHLLNVGASNPHDVSISTNASTNTAQATINVRNFGGRAGEGSPTATFQLGGISHQNGVPDGSSAFITNKIYGMLDQTSDPSRRTHISSGDRFNLPVASNTVLTSYGAAPLPGNKLPGGVTPCVCAFMSWGWWSGSATYLTGGYHPNLQTDTLNLATYVVGTLTNKVQLPNRGTATYSGSAIANVSNGGNSYTAAGGYSNSWNFGTQRGQVTISNLDGATYTGTTSLQNNTVNFNGGLSGAGRTGSLNGSFFSSPTNPVAGQGGNFNVTGPAYTAGGTFAAQKTGH